jgi:hypothetical protein
MNLRSLLLIAASLDSSFTHNYLLGSYIVVRIDDRVNQIERAETESGYWLSAIF